MVNKRGPYLKGRKILSWCLENADKLPFDPTVKNVQLLVQGLMQHDFVFKATVTNKERKVIAPVFPKQKGPAADEKEFAKEFYIWNYEGDQTTRNWLLGAIVGVVIFFCLMPAWPRFMKVGVWYLSCTLLLLLVGFSIVRMLIWQLVWIVSGYHLTIFPYIFIDGIPISEAFMFWGPATEYSGGSWYADKDTSMRYWRLAALAATAGIVVWVYNQPTEFDDYLATVTDFTDDLYSGNLLSDMAQNQKDNIDKPKYQSLRDILFEEAEEAAEADAAAAEVAEGKKKGKSLDEILAETEEDDEDDEAAAILNSILEDEESGEVNA